MRLVYAHQATLVPTPGVSVTLDLPEPHHLHTENSVDGVRLRVLFAAEPNRVDEVRDRLDAALAAGDWRLLDSGCTRVEASERPHARSLLRGAPGPSR